MKYAICLLILTLSGCQALHSPSEYTYQVLNVVDMGQTLYIADNPDRYYENVADWAIGRHPSRRSVVAFMGAEAVLHAGVTEVLLRNDMTKTAALWQCLTIGDKLNNTVHNYSIGVRMGF